jgi:crotonobetainyl-CoA:carnitine CoA-transferase CaiB-like acyl-CoA transferase
LSPAGATGPQAQPLAGVRVLECGDTLASAYAGRLLADLGAEVVVVEEPPGHPMRAMAPHLGASPGIDRSAGFACFAAGKRSVVYDPATEGEAATLADLAGRADVILRSVNDGHDRLTDELLEAAHSANPSLIVADLSTFGRLAGGRDLLSTPSGGDRVGGHPTSDLLALAAGGVLSVNATAPGDPTATPLRYRGELSSIHAATGAVLATLGALFEERRSGLGQRIDVSAQAAVAGIIATALPTYSYTGEVAVHDGTRGVAPWGFFACRDAMVLLQVTEDAQFRAFVDLLGRPEWGEMEIFATNTGRTEAMDVLDPLVAEALAAWSTDEFLAACHHHGVAAARIHTAADLLDWDHLAARRSFRHVMVADDHHRAAIRTPAPPWRYHGTEPLPELHSPRLGSTDPADLWASSRPSPAARTDDTTTPAPLAGVRVVDLTWVWAGPYAAMQLSHLGAEVVKVESSARLDVTRVLGPWAAEEPGPNRSGYYNQYNLGKQSIVLDLKSDRGRGLLRGLLERADVVIDNMRAGALDRMGFSYEELRALNPRLVAVSMTGFGETGPERDRMAYGSLIDALSGVASANGAPGGGPTDFPMSLPDPCAGIHTAIATVAALLRARRTGRGERVECSMLEASLAAFPWPVLYQGVVGHPAPVEGNRDELRAPHDVYRCRGTYEWVAISVETDQQFAALTEAIGRPELAADRRFASLAARRLHADALDEAIARWSGDRSPAEAASELRRAGVPAEAVARIDDVVADERLRSRGFLVELPHPEVGSLALAGPPWRASRSPMVATSAAPRLGEHTRSVLGRWLGLSDGELDELDRSAVLA